MGTHGTVIGLDRFGTSAPYTAIYKHLGLTAEVVVAAAMRVMGRSLTPMDTKLNVGMEV